MLFAITSVLAATLISSNVNPEKEVFYKELFDKPNAPVTKVIEDTNETLIIGGNKLTLTSISITNEDSKTARESTTKYFLLDYEALETIKTIKIEPKTK